MAFTITRKQTVFGNERVALLRVDIDSASGNVDTGLSVVDAVALCPISMATVAIGVDINQGSGATSLPGIINIGSGAAGDAFFMTVYGR